MLRLRIQSRIKVSGNDHFIDVDDVLEEGCKHMIEWSFNLLLELAIILLFDLLWSEVDLDLLLGILVDLNNYKVMQGLALLQWLGELDHYVYLLSVRSWELEYLLDILVHYLVIVGFTVELCEVVVHLHRVFASWNKHRQVFERNKCLALSVT